MRAGGDGLHQRVRQQHIQHAGLIHHDEVGIEGMCAVVGRLAARPELEQTMQRARFGTGELLQALGGAPCGGGQQYLRPLGSGQRDDGADGVTLAAAGTSREHGHPLGEGEAHRLGLLRGEGAAGLLLQPAEGHLPVDRLEGGEALAGGVDEAQETAGERPLGPVERDQVDGRDLASLATRERLTHHSLFRDQLI